MLKNLLKSFGKSAGMVVIDHMSGSRNPDDDNDGHTVYNDDGEDITKGLPTNDHKRPTPSDIPNEHGEYNF